MPGMLGDIVRETIRGQPDMEIVATVPNLESVDEAMRTTAIEVLVVGTDAPRATAPFRSLLQARPGLKILAVASDGGDLVLHELRPRAEPLGEVSPTDLLQAIRAAVGPLVG